MAVGRSASRRALMTLLGLGVFSAPAVACEGPCGAPSAAMACCSATGLAAAVAEPCCDRPIAATAPVPSQDRNLSRTLASLSALPALPGAAFEAPPFSASPGAIGPSQAVERAIHLVHSNLRI